jgi:hypothetical protein
MPTPPDLPKGAPIFVKINGVLTKATYHSWSDKYSMPLVTVEGRVLPRRIFAAPPETTPNLSATETGIKQVVDDTSTSPSPANPPVEPANEPASPEKARETKAEAVASFGKTRPRSPEGAQKDAPEGPHANEKASEKDAAVCKKTPYPLTVGTRCEIRRDGHYDIFNCVGTKISELWPHNIGSAHDEEKAVKTRVED